MIEVIDLAPLDPYNMPTYPIVVQLQVVDVTVYSEISESHYTCTTYTLRKASSIS